MSGPDPTLPIDFEFIRVALNREVTKVVGDICIEAEPTTQDAERPKLPYFWMKITTPAARYGDDAVSYVSGTQFNVGGNRKMTVSFNCAGNSHTDAYNMMGKWHAAIGSPAIRNELRASGIAVWQVGPVADLSQLLNTGYEGRAQMDVQFGIASNLTQDLGAIESAEVTGTVDTQAGIVDDDFNVPS